jgi:hypothetical protein
METSVCIHVALTSARTDLGSRNAVEAHAHENTSNGDLVVPKLDSVQVLNTERIGSDEGVKTEDQEHLSSGDQSASTLTDDVGDCEFKKLSVWQTSQTVL